MIGAPLHTLMQNVKNDSKIPPTIEKLITVIELNGLYMEGLYRKVGSQATIKELVNNINNGESWKLLFESPTMACLCDLTNEEMW